MRGLSGCIGLLAQCRKGDGYMLVLQYGYVLNTAVQYEYISESVSSICFCIVPNLFCIVPFLKTLKPAPRLLCSKCSKCSVNILHVWGNVNPRGSRHKNPSLYI
mgnify:CR=1 FL=1